MAGYFDTSLNRQYIFDDDLSIDGRYGKNNLRRGKWTSEEEAYANRLIQEFKAGLLPLTDGTTLRTFLSKLLNCDPMRISKKFVGQNCIGKQVFRRRQSDLDKLTSDDLVRNRQIMGDLEIKFLERLAQTNRCKSGSKDGKYYGDDFSNGPPVPWMIPPDNSPHSDTSSSTTTSSSSTTTTTTTITAVNSNSSSIYSQDNINSSNKRMNLGNEQTSNSISHDASSVSNTLNQQIHANVSNYQNSSVHYTESGFNGTSLVALNNHHNHYAPLNESMTQYSMPNPNVNVIENSNDVVVTGGNMNTNVNNNTNNGIAFNNDLSVQSVAHSRNNNTFGHNTGASENLIHTSTADSIIGNGLHDDNNMKRNQSIENFWMLVQLGDLPRPDEVVLVKGLWEEEASADTSNTTFVRSNNKRKTR